MSVWLKSFPLNPTYRADGPDEAMPKFMAHAGLAKGSARSPARRLHVGRADRQA
jgi:hypothetical protein